VIIPVCTDSTRDGDRRGAGKGLWWYRGSDVSASELKGCVKGACKGGTKEGVHGGAAIERTGDLRIRVRDGRAARVDSSEKDKRPLISLSYPPSTTRDLIRLEPQASSVLLNG
jgi:hypothetical protein